MRIDPKEIQELHALILDFAERKEWTVYCLLESLATIEFNMRLSMHLEGHSRGPDSTEGWNYDPQD